MSSSPTLLFLFLASNAFAGTVKPVVPVGPELLLEMSGRVYPEDQFPESCKNMFRDVKCSAQAYGQVHIESKKEGEWIHSKSIFSDPDGPQVTEESWEKDGHVKRTTVDNRALQKFLELEVVGDKVHYKVTDKTDGSVKTSEDDLEPNLVVPSTVMSYIRPKFQDLLAGGEVRLKVAVLDRRESFSFVIKKVREEKTVNGEEVLVLKMSPVSIIVQALVDPMFFYIKPKTGEMYAFEGRSALRRKVSEHKYKEMSVKTAYEYSVNQFKPAQVLESSANCSDDVTKPNSMKCSIPGATTPKDVSDENKTSVQN